MLSWTEYVNILVALLVILDPPGVSPMFLSATSDQTPAQRHRTARTTAIVTAALLIGTAIVGEWVLHVMGIRIATFRVGGGILLLLMSISMMNARISGFLQTPEEKREAIEKDDVAIVPLAIPLLAGPGALSTILIYANRSPDMRHKAVICGIVIIAALLTWITLRLAGYISPLLGKTGINVLTRLLGLVLAAVSIEFIATGLLELFPGLGLPQ